MRQADSGPDYGGASFTCSKDAIAELERRYGKCDAQWTYHNSSGDPVGLIVRWNGPNGKSIRPVSLKDGKWYLSGMPQPRTLYRLPEVAASTRIYIVEGEKAAEAARFIGLSACTLAHGASSANQTDWSPLAGKEVIIIPDNDDAGRTYSGAVLKILAKLDPAPKVMVVSLPNLPEHGDIADYVAAKPTADPADTKAEIEGLVDSTDWLTPRSKSIDGDSFQPFPTKALPEPLREFVEAGSAAIGCDPSYLALPLLTSFGAAIGNTRRLELKRGWTAPPILWTAVVGESGTAKTPAFQLVLAPVRERQRRSLKAYEDALKDFRLDIATWDKQNEAWKRDKNATSHPPIKPEPPSAERFVVTDCTVESPAPLLLHNPRGLLLARDELAGWIGSFDRYAGGKGGDSANWL